jgi:hypothetical protein
MSILETPNTEYSFYIGKKMPSLVFVTRKYELYQRLILRAAMADGTKEFELKLS